MSESKPKCELTGTDGNIFFLVAKASRTLKRAGLGDQAEEMQNRLDDCESYDEALQLIMEYVDAY